MKVPVSKAPAVAAPSPPVAITPKGNISFKSLYEAITSRNGNVAVNFDSAMVQVAKMRKELEGNKHIDAKDLLLYQIQVSELNLRVEMLSKAADSAVALTRKLQNAQ